MVALYMRDVHTPEAVQRMVRHPEIWLTPFHKVEIAHAIAQSVFRGQLAPQAADRLYGDFGRDCEAGLWRITDTPSATFETALALARLHVSRIGGRTLDTLHVAAALELKAQHFWTFDDRQAKLAKVVGLKLS